MLSNVQSTLEFVPLPISRRKMFLLSPEPAAFLQTSSQLMVASLKDVWWFYRLHIFLTSDGGIVSVRYVCMYIVGIAIQNHPHHITLRRLVTYRKLKCVIIIDEACTNSRHSLSLHVIAQSFHSTFSIHITHTKLGRVPFC